eukprot:2944064-Pyramimonas_sp.AAC.1
MGGQSRIWHAPAVSNMPTLESVDGAGASGDCFGVRHLSDFSCTAEVVGDVRRAPQGLASRAE